MPDGCLVRDPSPGARTETRVCEKSGAMTLHERVHVPPDPVFGGPGEWMWVCLGLTAAEFAAGQ
jgi:hypothetical protein